MSDRSVSTIQGSGQTRDVEIGVVGKCEVWSGVTCVVLRGSTEGEMQIAHMRAKAVADHFDVALCASSTSPQQDTH